MSLDTPDSVTWLAEDDILCCPVDLDFTDHPEATRVAGQRENQCVTSVKLVGQRSARGSAGGAGTGR